MFLKYKKEGIQFEFDQQYKDFLNVEIIGNIVLNICHNYIPSNNIIHIINKFQYTFRVLKYIENIIF